VFFVANQLTIDLALVIGQCFFFWWRLAMEKERRVLVSVLVSVLGFVSALVFNIIVHRLLYLITLLVVVIIFTSSIIVLQQNEN
jgi:hypothetical protein